MTPPTHSSPWQRKLRSRKRGGRCCRGEDGTKRVSRWKHGNTQKTLLEGREYHSSQWPAANPEKQQTGLALQCESSLDVRSRRVDQVCVTQSLVEFGSTSVLAFDYI